MPNYEEMWIILENFEFEFDEDSLINTSCIVCHKLLINACQGPCGCNFCKKCIDSYLSNEENFCPSQNNECFSESVDFHKGITKDNSANKRVSKLSVKCPSGVCDYVCPLIEMSAHLRVCNHVLKFCPFQELGCVPLKMKKDQITEHLLVEIYSHSQMMIEFMKHTKNEILSNIASEVNPVSLTDFENMVDVKIITAVKTFQNHQSTEKVEIRNLKVELGEIKTKLEELTKTINEITIFSEANISLLKKENISLNEELKILKEKKCKCELLLERSKNASFRDIFDQTDLTLKSSCESVGSSKVEIGYLKWPVEITGKDITSASPWGTLSEKFYSSQNQYEMRLRMWTDGCHGSHKSSHICLEFTITTGDIHKKVSLQSGWPITCFVSMTFRSVDVENNKKIVKTKQLTFKDGNTDCDLFSPWSSQFHFSISDLKKDSLIVNNSILLECNVYAS